MVQAAHNKQHEVIWWLYRSTRAPGAMKSVLVTAVHNGAIVAIVLLEWLRAKYRTHGFDPGGLKTRTMKWEERRQRKRALTYPNRLDMVEFLIDHELCEAGRALSLAAESCRLVMARCLHDRFWDEILSSPFYPLTQSVGLSECPPLWISVKTIIAAIGRGNFKL
ncbi:hypothetical protein JG687_00005950 [Phytophthora cactorum]|uniref:Uncharacterized protein n=1 Tax=Phytophthora cactorum TaxID=29920 RepID=A0A8T1UJG1_9STRA|nr:hypothetical protein JG687_00005950 [Phytophthora cactorum]